MDYLPLLVLPRNLIIFIFLLLGLIPLNGIPYFISATVSRPCLADTVISIEDKIEDFQTQTCPRHFYIRPANYPSTLVHL